MAREFQLELNCKNVQVAANNGNSVTATLDDVDPKDVLDKFDAQECIDHFSVKDILDQIGIEDCKNHFGLVAQGDD